MQRLSLKALTCHSGIREGCAGIAAKTTCCSGWGRCTLGTQGMLQLIVWEIRILLFIGTWSCPLTCQIYTEFCRILHNTRGTCFDKERSLSPQNGYQGRKGIETAMVLWRSARKTDNDSTPRFSGLRHALQSPRKNNKDRQGTSRSKNVSSMRGSKDLGQENTSQQYIHSETDPCPSFLFINLFFPSVFFPFFWSSTNILLRWCYINGIYRDITPPDTKRRLKTTEKMPSGWDRRHAFATAVLCRIYPSVHAWTYKAQVTGDARWLLLLVLVKSRYLL